MLVNDVWVPSAFINDINNENSKTQIIYLYDTWCGSSESRIHIKRDISDILEKLKSLIKKKTWHMIVWNYFAMSDIWKVVLIVCIDLLMVVLGI